jgi:amino acid adenylation domain-containing protein
MNIFSSSQYWKEQLKDAPGKIHLPYDFPHLETDLYQKDKIIKDLDLELSQKVKTFIKQHQVSPLSFFLTVFAILLNKYSNNEELNIGLNHSSNTLVTKHFFSGDHSFSELLNLTSHTIQKGISHSVPFDEILKMLNIEANSMTSALLQVGFHFLLQSESIDSSYPPYDILLIIKETGATYELILQYNTQIFRGDTIIRFVEHYTNLMTKLAENSTQKLAEISLLSSKERILILETWNNTAKDFPLEKQAIDLFEERVAKDPNRRAIVFEDQILTYKELNERANQLSHYMQQFHVQTEDMIGVCMPRSIEMVIALLAVMKLGAVYVPLDPNIPVHRLDFMVKDTGLKILVSIESLLNLFSEFEGSSICFDRDASAINHESKESLIKNSHSKSLAYLIYTSGSTGNPKGVLIEHQGLTNELLAEQDIYGFTENSVLLSVTAYSFDASISEILAPLIAGAFLVIAPEKARRDVVEIRELIQKYDVTVLELTPTAWLMLLDSGWEGSKNMTAEAHGEPLKPELAKRLLKHCKSLLNGYGPTETSITSSFAIVNPEEEIITIGRPLANVTYYILDSNLQPVPIGVPGTLYIGGVGVGRGYLNQPKLTEEKFIRDPFVNLTHARIYNSGDLARYLPDGRVQCLGRADQQVKIRGNRMELGDIEAKLTQISGVQDAVVTVKESNELDKYLVGYIIPVKKDDISLKDLEKQNEFSHYLKKELKKELPNYMIPSVFVLVDTFQHTTSGKVDRKKLPEPPDFEQYFIQKENLVAKLQAANTSERFLILKTFILDTVRELMDIPESVPLDEKKGFFDLGLDSADAIELRNRIHKSLDNICEIKSTAFFDYPTIASLAHHIETKLHAFDDWLFEFKWIESQSFKKRELIKDGLWLIFSDVDEPIIPILLDNLQQVIVIRSGDNYNCVAKNTYVLNPNSEQDFVRLYNEISNTSKLQGIIYAWGCASSIDLHLQEFHQHSITGLVTLAKTIGMEKQIGATPIYVVTHNLNTDGNLESLAEWPLSGICKVIHEEFPLINCFYIALNSKETPENLFHELVTDSIDFEILLRDQKRYVPRLVRSNAIPAKIPQFLPDASYLIAGGLRPLGLLIAKWYVQHGAKHIILLDEPGIKTSSQELEGLDAQFYIYEALFDDSKTFSTLFKTINETLPPLKGVLHVAGFADNDLLMNMTWTRFDPIYRLKVAGSWNLHQFTEKLDLDHFILFSSALVDIFPLGKASHAVGNSFLDALSFYRHKKNLPCLSIDWGLWGGKHIIAGQLIQYNLANRFKILEINDVYLLLEKLFYNSKAQIVAAPIKWDNVLRPPFGDNPLFEEIAIEMGYKKANLQDSYKRASVTNRITVLSQYLYNLIERNWPSTLTKVKEDHDFGNIGFTILEMATLKNRIQFDLGEKIALSPQIITENSNFSKIVEAIAELLDREILTNESLTEQSGNILNEPIAIIGIACRFPGGNNPDAFWNLLNKGGDGVTEVPPSRWDADSFYDPDPAAPGKMISKFGGFLDIDVSQFDAPFFHISPKEAEYMDPQQRLLLEVSYEAIESAGIAPSSLAGSKTGVFIGICGNDYVTLINETRDKSLFSPYLATGNSASIASGRISFIFDFQGPNMAIDTACSSSLVAIDEACKSLRYGESNLSLAGGVNLILSPDLSIEFSKVGILSPEGHCKTFDAAANGYVRGEGCGMIVLKRLTDAKRDGDQIFALIKASGINQDGATSGITVPNGEAQEELIRNVLKKAKLQGADIDYVEAHGTGTSLGDPIEVRAIGATYGNRDIANPLKLGSVKTNIGHLEGAAGVAGVIKMVLALQNEVLPAHLHFKKLNPHIQLDFPAKISTDNLSWERNERIRRSAVSSFGFSGTNAHLILEEAPFIKINEIGDEERPLHILTISAKTESSLEALLKSYADFLTHTQFSLPDICYTANTGRNHERYRMAFIAKSLEELKQKMDSRDFIKGEAKETKSHTFNFSGEWTEDMNQLALAYVNGAEVDWKSFDSSYARKKVTLPIYPFQRSRYWVEAAVPILGPNHEEELSSIPPVQALIELIKKTQTEEKIKYIEAYIHLLVYEIAKIPIATAEFHVDLSNYGFDSLMYGMIANQLVKDFNININIADIQHIKNLNELALILHQNQIHIQKSVQDVTLDSREWTVLNKPEMVKSFLFICPPFGFGEFYFRNWIKSLPNDVEVHVVGFKFDDDWNETINFLAEKINHIADKPFILFGHSMGGIVAYELALALQNQYNRKPIALLISSAVTPPEFFKIKNTHPFNIFTPDLPIERQLVLLREIHYLPSEILDIKTISESEIKSDISAFLNYQRENMQTVSSPIVGIHADKDILFDDEGLIMEWKQYTPNFSYLKIPGSHLYFMSPPKNFFDEIIKLLP